MNKQMLFFALTVITVLVFILFSGTFEPYTVSSSAFASRNNFVTLDTKGNIKLQPVVDVDNAIDLAVGGFAQYAADTYNSTFLTKADAHTTYQPKGEYVKKCEEYSIKMGKGNASKTGNHYMVGTGDNWRVAYNGGPESKWTFI